jgi:uncharacterized protein (DUF2147 family)
MRMARRFLGKLSLFVAAAAAWPSAPPDARADVNSPVGRWRTYEAGTNELRSIVEITQVGGEMQGKVVERFPPPGDPTGGLCVNCQGDLKNKPVLGMIILWGVKREGDGWGGGTILAPQSGNTFSVKLQLEDQGRKLQVRAFVGSPMFGQTQSWLRDGVG